jgi:small subunit ribosomal protein S17
MAEEQEQIPQAEGEQQPAERKRAKVPPPPPVDPAQRRAEKLAQRKRKAALRRAYRQRLRERRRQQRAQAGGQVAPATAAVPKEHGRKRVRQGVVRSAKAAKTITVEITIARRHPRYEKIVKRTRKVHAHDEHGEAREGDVVRVVESRPLSRTKRWRLLEIVERAK